LPVDHNALVPEIQLTLGPISLFMILAALVSLIKGQKRAFTALLLGLGAAATLAAWLLPTQIWLLGVATLMLAISSTIILTISTRAWWAILLLLVVLIASLPATFTPRWPAAFGDTRPIDQLRYEQQGYGVAALPPSYAIPLPLPALPPANRYLLAGYEINNINKILPLPTVRTTVINHQTHAEHFQIIANNTTTLEVLTSYFPGWQVTAGNATLIPNPQTGRINLRIGPMNGQVIMALDATPVRTAAWIITWVTLITLLLRVRWRYAQNRPAPHWDTDLLAGHQVRASVGLFLGFALLVVLFTAPNAPFPWQPTNRLAAATAFRLRTDVGLETQAFTLNQSQLRPGNTLRLTLFWQTLTPLPENYQVRVSLINPDDQITTVLRDPGYYPTRRWRSFRYIQDVYDIPIPTDMVPGTYALAVEAYTCSPNCDTQLTFFAANGRQIGPVAPLPAAIEILR
jgi:hypothetical protein